jgi:hypothetical protein
LRKNPGPWTDKNTEAVQRIKSKVKCLSLANPNYFKIVETDASNIIKILSPKEWALDPNGEKSIRISEDKIISFNYWDYIQAFTQAFYYQNPKNKHS